MADAGGGGSCGGGAPGAVVAESHAARSGADRGGARRGEGQRVVVEDAAQCFRIRYGASGGDGLVEGDGEGRAGGRGRGNESTGGAGSGATRWLERGGRLAAGRGAIGGGTGLARGNAAQRR